MPGITLFSNQAGNATSTVVGRVRQTIGNTKVERILVAGNGSWNDATVRFQVSVDNVTFQDLTDASGYAIGLYGDDFASLLDLPGGTYFKVIIADSAFPQSTLTIKASGDVESV
jgi:hypothetical protein